MACQQNAPPYLPLAGFTLNLYSRTRCPAVFIFLIGVIDLVTVVKFVREHEFEGSDGKMVKGAYFYFQVTKPDGTVVDKRQFIPDDRLAGFAFIPKAGNKVLIYTHEGKIVDMLQDK